MCRSSSSVGRGHGQRAARQVVDDRAEHQQGDHPPAEASGSREHRVGARSRHCMAAAATRGDCSARFPSGHVHHSRRHPMETAMRLTRHDTSDGVRWALDGLALAPHVTLRSLLDVPRGHARADARGLADLGAARRPPAAAGGRASEVWAAGVTYLRSREAREAESSVKDVLLPRVRGRASRAVLQVRGVARRRPRRAHPHQARQRVERAGARVDARREHGARDRRLLRGQRRVLARHRRREPALPAAGQGLRRRVRARTGDPGRRGGRTARSGHRDRRPAGGARCSAARHARRR